MDLKDISTQIATAINEPIETLHNLRARQRERWFKTEILEVDGEKVAVKVEQYEYYLIDGKLYKFPVIGMESPEKLALSKVTVGTNSDMGTEDDEGGLRKLVLHLHSHSDEISETELTIEFERVPASEGIMALHKRAVREIKQICLGAYPEVEKQEALEAELERVRAESMTAQANLAIKELEAKENGR